MRRRERIQGDEAWCRVGLVPNFETNGEPVGEIFSVGYGWQKTRGAVSFQNVRTGSGMTAKLPNDSAMTAEFASALSRQAKARPQEVTC